ncbi:MAG: hypothetical protein QOF01_4174, partial [Thermomicrobiales bacterium]|nr:hypothetical protein [Thermomicrobiales bacterium]
MLRHYAGFLALVLSVVVLTVPAAVGAQDATPSSRIDTAAHPLVGSWVIDTNADEPDNPPALVVFHADGTLIELHER